MNQREYLAALERLKTNPATFRASLLIETDDGPQRLAETTDDWQEQDFKALDPALRKIAGHNVKPTYQRAWWERGRGHSKTTDIAVCATWLLFASRRRIDGIASAADKDQAALVLNAIDRLLRLNEWLADYIEVQSFKIVNKHTGSTLTILAADVASSWGLLIDFAICDEVTHWPNRALFDSILSAVAKKRYALLLVIANASWRDHFSWELREAVRQDPAWYFHRLDGCVASWISKEHLEEQRRLLLTKEFDRLWGNEWQDSSGNALDARDRAAVVTLKGPQGYRSDRVYIGSLDLGLKHDHSALVVFACDYRNRVVELANLFSWRPEDNNGSVDLIEVKHTVLQAARSYQLRLCVYDPWQCQLMAQELVREGVNMVEFPFTPANKDQMARALLDAFRNRLIALYPDKALQRDLARIRLKEGPLGYRLDALKDENGHCDRAIALSAGLPVALYLARDYDFNRDQVHDEILYA